MFTPADVHVKMFEENRLLSFAVGTLHAVGLTSTDTSVTSLPSFTEAVTSFKIPESDLPKPSLSKVSSMLKKRKAEEITPSEDQ
jgi:hypothetical protein